MVLQANMKYGLLCLSNNSSVTDCFKNLRDRFNLLYKHKAHVHHYYKFMPDKGDFDKAIYNVSSLIDEYEDSINKKVNVINKSLIPEI